MTQGSAGSEPSRIVVRSPNWLGDAVMTLPFVRDVRRHFSTAHLAVATPTMIEAFYRAVPGVDEVIGLRREASAGRWRQDGEHAAVLKSGRFDAGILLPNSFGSALTFWRAGIPERWGYRGNCRSRFLTRAIRRPRARPLHQAQYYLELARGLGLEVGALDGRVVVPEADRQRARGLLDAAGCRSGNRLVGMAPGAAYGGAKRWPPDRVAQVVSRLTVSADVVCLLVGSQADRATARDVENHLKNLAGHGRRPGGDTPMVVNLVGRTTLGELMGLLSYCRAVVSNDSGAMHLAAAIGLPVVATFGPTDERVTAPLGRHRILQHPVRCRPCMLRECPIDHRCMKGISSDMVSGAIEDYLRDV